MAYQPRHAAVRRGRHAAPRRPSMLGPVLILALLVVVVGASLGSLAWAGPVAHRAGHGGLPGNGTIARGGTIHAGRGAVTGHRRQPR